jgi:hypothetical protein
MNRAALPNNQQSIDQLLIFGKTPSGELQPCTANRSDEDLSRRYALSQPTFIFLSATQQVQRQTRPSACASCYRRLVAANIDRKTAPLRPALMAPDNKKRRPLGIRPNSVLSPTFKIQHPTFNIHPSALPLTSANRTYPAATLAHKGMPRRHLLAAPVQYCRHPGMFLRKDSTHEILRFSCPVKF